MDNTNPAWMIYGVNGYTGRLCAEEALRRGLRPVVAGRSAERVARVAGELGLPHRVFDVVDVKAATAGLEGMTAVLNCAGPFSATARPMLDACVAAGTHYLDVTGEIGVFEHVHQNSARWKDAGIVALPGVGADVVPTDCIAAMLKEALPGAVMLTLAFKTAKGHLSPGTAKTVVESLGGGPTLRRNGVLISVPMASLSRMIPYGDGAALSAAIPWGDVSTAFYSTGIPDIVVYTAMPEDQLRMMRRMGPFLPILGLAPVRYLLKRLVEWRVTGPDAVKRGEDTTEFYGEAADAAGNRAVMTLHAPNGYTLTYDAAVSAVDEVLKGAVAPGAHTPSTAFGASFLSRVNDVRITPPAIVPA